jgi:hypothetical protein
MKNLKDIAYLIKLRYIPLFAGLVSLTGFFAWQYESWRAVTYVIPPGVGVGQATVVIPAEIVLTVGIRDTLVIENQDNVIHVFGPFIVGPESTFSKRFRTPRLYEGACTFHPGQEMRVVINPAPWTIAFWNRNAAGE